MARRRRGWIQKAIKHPGALRAWAKRNRQKIKRVTGRDPFNKDGTLSMTTLRRLKHTKWYRQLSPSTKRRINLALTLHKLKKH